MTELTSRIKEISWQEAREYLSHDEPELVSIIDGLSPADMSPIKAYNLLQIDYAFGEPIFKDKEVHIPTAERALPLSHPNISQKLKDLLGYSPLPLGFIANQHGVEIYRELGERVHSIAFFARGLHMGVWEFFDPPTPFTVVAGARSMILLPKVTDHQAHATLRQYNVTSHPPISPFNQWHIFREMANAPNFPTPWHCRMIYFTKPWAEKIRNDKKWLEFKYYALKRVWEHTNHSRYRLFDNEMWELFFSHLAAKNIKPTSYIKDFFRHLIYIALSSSAMTAHKPTNGDIVAGPINDFLKIYLETYNLQYIPTLMVPCHFLADGNDDPVYCSLQIPSYWDSSPLSRNSVNIKKDLESLIWLYDTFKHELACGRVHTNVANSNIRLQNISCDFFHNSGKTGERIAPPSSLPDGDKNFLYMPGRPGQYGQRKFADHSSFINGCVRISLKK